MHATNSKPSLVSPKLIILLLGAKITARLLESKGQKKRLLLAPNPCSVSLKIQ